MTLEQLHTLGIREVYLRSYGYTECSILGDTWQPFGNKAREIKFTLDDYCNLSNPTFWCEEDPELTDKFNLVDGKYISVSDYDLCSR